MNEFCFFCGDTEKRPGWVHIGGTIGETHYVCHRKKCKHAQLGYMLRLKKLLDARRSKGKV